jgi:hypothetical protein
MAWRIAAGRVASASASASNQFRPDSLCNNDRIAKGIASKRAADPLLQVVADYTRLSAVPSAGRVGHKRALGPQYPGMRTADFIPQAHRLARLDQADRSVSGGVSRSWNMGLV